MGVAAAGLWYLPVHQKTGAAAAFGKRPSGEATLNALDGGGCNQSASRSCRTHTASSAQTIPVRM